MLSSWDKKSVMCIIFCVTFDLHGALWSQASCFPFSLIQLQDITWSHPKILGMISLLANQASKAILPTFLKFLFNYLAFGHCMCVWYTWVCMHVHRHAYLCVERSKSTLSGSLNGSIHYILKQRLLLKLELSALLNLTSQLCARDFRKATVSTQLCEIWGSELWSSSL